MENQIHTEDHREVIEDGKETELAFSTLKIRKHMAVKMKPG